MIPFLGCYHYPTFSCLPFWVPPPATGFLNNQVLLCSPKGLQMRDHQTEAFYSLFQSHDFVHKPQSTVFTLPQPLGLKPRWKQRTEKSRLKAKESMP